MHFHKTLVVTILASICLAAPCFYLAISKSTYSQAGLFVVFGWMFWIALFGIVGPLLVTRKITKDWFIARYVWGTIILAILHMVGLIMLGYYVAVFQHRW